MRDQTSVTLPSEVSPTEFAKQRNYRPLTTKELAKGKESIKIFGTDTPMPWGKIYSKIRLDLPYEDIGYEYGHLRKIILWAEHDGITADPTVSKMFDDEVKNRSLQKEIAKIDPLVVETMQEAVNAYAPDVRKDVVIFASALVKKAIHGVNDDDATSNDINNYAKAVQTVTDTLEVTQRHSAGINVNGASSVQVQGFEFVLDTPPEKDVIDVTHEESDNG